MSSNPLNDYLSGFAFKPLPKRGQRPVETRRIPFETLELRGTRLGFGDTWMFLDGVAVACSSGSYALEAECYCYGSDARVARVSAIRTGRHGKRGALCGSFGVDVGSACIVDYDALEGYADHNAEAYDQWLRQQVIDAEPVQSGSAICAAARTSMVFFACGFGDGYYSVYERRDGHELVGAEVVFLADDAPYPFGEER